MPTKHKRINVSFKLKTVQALTRLSKKRETSLFHVAQELVEEALGKTVDKIKTAEVKAAGSLSGEVSMEELAIAVANAEMSLKTVITIRDKLITAFQDIIRMPI